jgi:hypothetical protein
LRRSCDITIHRSQRLIAMAACRQTDQADDEHGHHQARQYEGEPGLDTVVIHLEQ